MSEAYPFESDDDIEISELDLESVDAVAEQRVTVGQLAGESESWRYGHVIVDEAQDLTPMQWRMIMRRVRGRSLTIVGDLAQRSADVVGAWPDVLPPELQDAQRQDLTVNYRSPVEIHDLATAVLAQYAPLVSPSLAIRSSGTVPLFHRVDDIAAAVNSRVRSLLSDFAGQVAVIASAPANIANVATLSSDERDRVRFLTPNESKGLEFDAVLLVEPAEVWECSGGPAQLYIALTRATQQLFVVHQKPLPSALLID